MMSAVNNIFISNGFKATHNWPLMIHNTRIKFRLVPTEDTSEFDRHYRK